MTERHDAGYALQVKINPGTSRERWRFDRDLGDVRETLTEAWSDRNDAVADGYPASDVRVVGLSVIVGSVQ